MGGPLPPHANSSDLIQFTNNLYAEVIALRAEISKLESVGTNLSGQKVKEKHLKDLKSFSAVPVWNGNEKDFSDYEFKLHQLSKPFNFFEKRFDWVKHMDTVPTFEVLDQLARSEYDKDASIDLHWMNRQIYPCSRSRRRTRPSRP